MLAVRSSALATWLSRFFFEHAAAPLQIRLFRFLFFGLLALDTFVDLAHAPRYGAGGFNVSHFPLLDGLLPMPDRVLMGTLWIAQSYLAARIAVGAFQRWMVWLLTALYAWTYFISQLDSYQHHYLVFLFLVILSWVRWDEDRPPAWPIKLALVQVSIVYLWAALAKLDPLWLDGTLMTLQAGGSDLLRDVAYNIGLTYSAFMIFLSWATLIVELFLAVAIHVRRLRAIAFFSGVAFHVAIEAAGYKIGLFSYFMVAVYVLVLPAPWMQRLSDCMPAVARRPLALSPAMRVALWAVALAAGVPLVLWLPFEGAPGAALVITLTAALAALSGGARTLSRASAHVLACALLLLFHTGTDTAQDYYRFLGGDSRRRGDVATAIMAYEKTVEMDSTYVSGWKKLADLYRRDGRRHEADAALRRAREMAPFDRDRGRSGRSTRVDED